MMMMMMMMMMIPDVTITDQRTNGQTEEEEEDDDSSNVALKDYHHHHHHQHHHHQGAGRSGHDARLRRGQEVCGPHGVGLGPPARQSGVGGRGQAHGADHHGGRRHGAGLGALLLLVVVGQLAVEGDGVGGELGQVFGAAVPRGAEKGGGLGVVLGTVQFSLFA